MEVDTLMKIASGKFPSNNNSRIGILLNTQDYNCYNSLISTVASQNFIRFLHEKAEVLKTFSNSAFL